MREDSGLSEKRDWSWNLYCGIREVASKKGDRKIDSQGDRLGLGDTWIRGVTGRMQSPWQPGFKSSQPHYPLLPGMMVHAVKDKASGGAVVQDIGQRH